mmetsp:Transcript_11282/g.43540  ORF Transcript_11282/g.43540 Transcript_11282/m.43540 type:complete len:296 (+) Transcript_11282:721-1608(+)
MTVAPTNGGRPVSAWKMVAPIAQASAFRPLYGFPVRVSGAANAAVPAVEAMASSVPSKICATPKSLTFTQSDSPSPASSRRTAAAAVTVPSADPTNKSAGVKSWCDGPASMPLSCRPESPEAEAAPESAPARGIGKCDNEAWGEAAATAAAAAAAAAAADVVTPLAADCAAAAASAAGAAPATPPGAASSDCAGSGWDSPSPEGARPAVTSGVCWLEVDGAARAPVGLPSARGASLSGSAACWCGSAGLRGSVAKDLPEAVVPASEAPASVASARASAAALPVTPTRRFDGLMSL